MDHAVRTIRQFSRPYRSLLMTYVRHKFLTVGEGTSNQINRSRKRKMKQSHPTISNNKQETSSKTAKTPTETVRLEILQDELSGSKDSKTKENWRDVGPINLLSDNDNNYKHTASSTSFETEATVKPLTRSVKELLGGAKYYSYRHSPDGIDSNLLILLHGSGDSHLPYDCLAHKMALPQTACLSLSASIPNSFVTIPFDLGFTWFEEVDYYETGMELPPQHPRRLRSLEKAISSLNKILSCLIKDNGWISERIFLFGFSCGACLAMETVLDRMLHSNSSTHSSTCPLGGVVCVAGGIKSKQSIKAAHPKNKSSILRHQPTPILLVIGSNDTSFSPSQAQESKKIYASAVHSCMTGTTTNIPSNVTIHVQKNKAHGMISSAEEMHAIMVFLADKLVKRMVGFNGKH